MSSSKDFSRINRKRSDSSDTEFLFRHPRILSLGLGGLSRKVTSPTPSFVAESGKPPDISLWKTPLISSRASNEAGNRKSSAFSEPNFTWAVQSRPKKVVLPELRSPTITTRGICNRTRSSLTTLRRKVLSLAKWPGWDRGLVGVTQFLALSDRVRLRALTSVRLASARVIPPRNKWTGRDSNLMRRSSSETIAWSGTESFVATRARLPEHHTRQVGLSRKTSASSQGMCRT